MSEDRQGRSGDSNKILYCSFCGKSQHEVRKLIAGPSVFICDECVELCNDIIREELEEKAQSARSSLPKPREATLAAQIDRTRARLLLAEAQPAEALALFRALTERRVDTETEYYRLWAWDGVSRSELALGNKGEAAAAMQRAAEKADRYLQTLRTVNTAETSPQEPMQRVQVQEILTRCANDAKLLCENKSIQFVLNNFSTSSRH